MRMPRPKSPARMHSIRALLLSAGAVILNTACAAEDPDKAQPIPDPTSTMPTDLVIYSPAPPRIMLHAHNVQLGEILSACDSFGEVQTPPIALPDSINEINALSADVRPFHLPIVTTLDFETAINQTAPDWHGYTKANSDLRFVASLYDVSFGILAFDADIHSPQDLIGKRIAAPPRPSSVRWFTEALLRDGWGILDQVELVDLTPPELPGALADGSIDATSWNIMSETPQGFLPLMPPLLDHPTAHWISVDDQTVTQINSANPFNTESVDIAAGAIRSTTQDPSAAATLLSFRQALAAWSDTPDEVVAKIIDCLENAEPDYGSGSGFETDRWKWPDLDIALIHPAAR